MYFISLLTLGFLVVSCGNSSEETQIQLPTIDTAVRYGNKNFTLPALSPNAREEAIKWSVYEDFENEITQINGSNIEALLSSTERLVQFSDSLIKTVPPTLNEQAISSRLLVTKTRANLLHQEIRLSRLDSLAIETKIEQLNQATKNLIVRINEKFTKQSIDLERKDDEEAELKKQKKFQDSVFQVELRDRDN
ncbi:hypothetical protein ACFQO1_01235 [Jejudonia soesokkakensis]|uniref:ATPase n=1 Tax=Jejudonia soesokkakensis TaxID=1323432 RepID=A0ABW2MN28_9FLAO